MLSSREVFLWLNLKRSGYTMVRGYPGVFNNVSLLLEKKGANSEDVYS